MTNITPTLVLSHYVSNVKAVHLCEGTECVMVYKWLVPYGPMLIPRQLRFSLYSGAVITEGLM